MKLIKKLLSTFILMLVIMTSINIVEVNAVENGVYVAPVSVDYRNPETGLIEDGGSEENYELGLGMCNSIVGSEALLEVDNGKKYITLRFSLMSNISNVSISVQSSSRGSYYNVTPEVTKSGDDWKDYRFQVSDENLYISPTLYVTPMQRNVKFFVKVNASAASAGNGSFSLKIQTNTANNQSSQNNTIESNNTVNNSNALNENVDQNVEEVLQNDNIIEENNEVEDESEVIPEEVDEEINIEDAEGASEYTVTSKATLKKNSSNEKINKGIIVIVVIAILGVAGTTSAVIYKKYKKR